MKRWLIALAVLAVGAGVWLIVTQRPGHQPLHLTVNFTCDIRGRLVPCGCFTGQMGGLTRIASLVGHGSTPGALKVDVGDAIEGIEDFHRIEYRYILEAFAKLGYEAANLGHREAALSAAQLRLIKGEAPIPLLSANLLETSTGQPLFDAYRIVQRGDRRIALVGVMDSGIAPDALGDGLFVERIETTLARLLPSLSKQADAIILLAFVDEAKLAKLAHEFYELDVILGGKVSQPSQQLVRENRSAILYTTNESRALGLLELTLDGPGQVTVRGGEVVLVHDRVSEDETIRSLAVQYRDEIRRTALAVDDPAALQADMVPGVKAVATYMGSESCVGCHAGATKIWADSGHAHAFNTLVQQKADADPNCIACHTVGFGSPSGYRRAFGESKLTNVGCESCHGPGSQHVAQRQAGGEVTARFRPIGAGDCQKCHHGEFSRPFVWETFWPGIRHGKEAAAVSDAGAGHQ